MWWISKLTSLNPEVYCKKKTFLKKFKIHVTEVQSSDSITTRIADFCVKYSSSNSIVTPKFSFNPLNSGLFPLCHVLALLGARLIFHVSRTRVQVGNLSPTPINNKTRLHC